MFILRIVDIDGAIQRDCSIVAFDTNECGGNKIFYFKQRLDDEEWHRIYFKKFSMYYHNMSYPIIEVVPEPIGKVEEK